MIGTKEQFQIGDIVYWCGYDEEKGRSVRYGIIDEIYRRDSDNGIERVIVDYLTTKSYRKINGIPIDEFESEARYRKLPKNWSYDTRLFDDTEDIPADVRKRYQEIDWTNPQDILAAYNDGILVKKKDNPYRRIKADITKKGFRIVETYEWDSNQATHTTLQWYEIHPTYAEVKAEVDAYRAELKRQSELSDEEWAIEQIDKELAKWKSIHSISDDRFEYARNQVLSLESIENVDVRILGGLIQWTRWKRDAKGLHHGKWHTIDIK